jgi:uncharacterized protein YdhG (YjbR/CyaY superfamily)
LNKSVINEVNDFINKLNHPLKSESLELRNIILTNFPKLHEHIKWNGFSFQKNEEDFLTFNFSNLKEIRLILHRGAKNKVQPQEKLIKENFVLLKWASNDRDIVTFTSKAEIKNHSENLVETIANWIKVLH